MRCSDDSRPVARYPARRLPADLTKPFDQLTPDDLRAHPVWEYNLEAMTPDHERPMVRPVLEALPVKTLNSERLASTTLTLANGSTYLGLLHNVSLHHPAATDQFLGVTIFRDDGRH